MPNIPFVRRLQPRLSRTLDSQTMPQGKCCRVVEQAAAAARERRDKRRSAQPWVIRKFMLVITSGIMGYAAYVYIGRLCVPMIQRRRDAGAGRGTGIALLVVFAVLYLWMVWAYVKIVITPPGYAKDYATCPDKPLIPANFHSNKSRNSTNFTHNDVELGHRDSHISQPPNTGRGLAGPSYEDLMKRDGSIINVGGVVESNRGPNIDSLDSKSNPATNVTQQPSNQNYSETLPSSAFEPALSSNTVVSSSPRGKTKLAFGHKLKLQKSQPVTSITSSIPVFQSDKRLEKLQRREARLQALHVDRRPPTTAVLQPMHRYCLTEEFVKPYRAHHCRSCGTCVLKYDHHCPWIGQCVGARNHKFFVNFCQATTVFTAFVLATVLAFVIRINATNGSLDAQKIVIIAMAGLFLIFAWTLMVTHVRMILTGMTTVEIMQMQAMQEREKKLLGKVYGWWEIRAKARKLREWDKEWGALSTEGNIWWRGNRQEEWMDVMGGWWMGWILPVGRSQNDGLTYPVNLRFDGEGRWRKRADWPEELR